MPRCVAALVLACLLALAGRVPAALAQGAYVVPNFTVQVTLSPKAAARMAALREGLIVAAYYSGEPSAAGRSHADQMGQINLGAQNVTLAPGVTTATFAGRSFAAQQIAWVKDRAVQLLINIYTARRSGPNNLLDCEIFEDSLAVAAQKPILLACKLIGES